jgi:hypothetical protein
MSMGANIVLQPKRADACSGGTETAMIFNLHVHPYQTATFCSRRSA